MENITEVAVRVSEELAQPLIVSSLHGERFVSESLNRKMSGVFDAGIVSGFTPELAGGMILNVTSKDAKNAIGAALIDNSELTAVTVRQLADVPLTIPAGAVSIVVIEAVYGRVITKQVNVNSNTDAAVIKIVSERKDNQVEICRLDVPAGANELTAEMLDVTHRQYSTANPGTAESLEDLPHKLIDLEFLNSLIATGELGGGSGSFYVPEVIDITEDTDTVTYQLDYPVGLLFVNSEHQNRGVERNYTVDEKTKQVKFTDENVYAGDTVTIYHEVVKSNPNAKATQVIIWKYNNGEPVEAGLTEFYIPFKASAISMMNMSGKLNYVGMNFSYDPETQIASLLNGDKTLGGERIVFHSELKAIDGVMPNAIQGFSFKHGGAVKSYNEHVLHEPSGAWFFWNGEFPKYFDKETTPFDEGVGSRWLVVGGSTILKPSMFASEKDNIFNEDPMLNDWSDVLEKAVKYCAPFEWKGSVSETKKQLGKVRASLSDFGDFRITRPLLINPYLVISCEHQGGFFDQNGGFRIIADFDGKDLFALDTAPYDSTGTRILGKLAGRRDWDDGLFTGCMGWALKGVSVHVPNGRNLRGTLNRCMAVQSAVNHCSLTGGNIGIQTSTTWGGSVEDCHIVARAIGLHNANDTTVDYQNNNYVSVLGTKPTTEEFTYPKWPASELQGKTTPLYCSYGHPVCKGNTFEGGEILTMLTNSSAINIDDNYYEAKNAEYVIAAHTVDFSFKARTVIAASAGLFHLRACNVSFDATSITYLEISGWGLIALADSSVRVSGSYTNKIKNIPWHRKVIYSDIDVNGEINIYVSGLGSDSNSGYSASKPVKTLQEAVDRLSSGASNIINIDGVVGTKYTYSSGGNATTKKVSIRKLSIIGINSAKINVGSDGYEVHSLPVGIDKISIINTEVVIPIVGNNYKPLIPCSGVVDIEIDNSSFTGGVLMGCKYQGVGIANLSVKNSILSCILQHPGEGGFAWSDVAFGVDVSGGSLGSADSKKIISMLYPQ